MELIEKLGVDLKLLIANIINFVLLLWILGRFVYKPVLALLEKRRKMVEKSVQDSKQAEELLADIEKTRLEAISKIKIQSVQMLEEASKQAEVVKKQITDTAHRQAELIIEQAKHQISLEKSRMMKEMEQDVAHLIVSATSRILEREFSDSDQKRLEKEALEQFTIKN